MSDSRERYDDRIQAHELEPDDELHLTFMGGDDYVTVDDVFWASAGTEITWSGQTYGGQIGDTIPATEEVWVRKGRRS